MKAGRGEIEGLADPSACRSQAVPSQVKGQEAPLWKDWWWTVLCFAGSIEKIPGRVLDSDAMPDAGFACLFAFQFLVVPAFQSDPINFRGNTAIHLSRAKHAKRHGCPTNMWLGHSSSN